MAETPHPTFEDRCIISCGMLHPEITYLIESGSESTADLFHAARFARPPG
jgi:hypothetical protein